MVSDTVRVKRKLKRKKERISKHILASREKKQDEEKQNNNDPSSIPKDNETVKQNKKQKKSQHVKDPREAHTYLMTWKEQSKSTSKENGGWKFNKNCQSWLIRHMYEPEKVLKATFGILMEYLVDLKGNTRDRVIADATRRALRYKQWEKDEKPNDSDEKAKTENEEDTTTPNKDEEKEEQQTWIALSDHDKRKEYKRARKVLETLK